jgi:hypothetical protein
MQYEKAKLHRNCFILIKPTLMLRCRHDTITMPKMHAILPSARLALQAGVHPSAWVPPSCHPADRNSKPIKLEISWKHYFIESVEAVA